MKPHIVLVALLLAACDTGASDFGGEAVVHTTDAAGPAEEAGSEAAALELCAAADYRPLIGTQVAAAALPAGSDLRVFGENDIVTQEYLPRRTNVVYDGGGVITRVWCG